VVERAAAAAVTTTRVAGRAAWALRAGPTRFVVVPALGLLGTSLRHGTHEYLDLGTGPERVLDGHTCGLPLLAPWANRLSADRYRVGGRTVELAGAPGLHREEHGLAIHGTMVGRTGWEVGRVTARRGSAVLVARFDAAADEEVMASFPFPHVLEVTYRLRPGVLAVTTRLSATGRTGVPVAFGWHPYFRLRGEAPGDLRVHVPTVDRLALDGRMLPTGGVTRQRASRRPLSPDGHDDAVRFASARRSFTLSGRRRALRISMDAGYPYGQVYSPAGSTVVALEPMTAAINALVTGGADIVGPGESFAATFRLSTT
jgi:galactose mutarotase-like enzyme